MMEDDDMKFRNYNSIEEAHLVKHLDKEREYKTQRNLYLSGFALTLIFVIGRITDLMQEHVDLEDDLQKLRSLNNTHDATPVLAEESKRTGEIEMKSMPSKKQE
jgi:hypothetical protein